MVLEPLRSTLADLGIQEKNLDLACTVCEVLEEHQPDTVRGVMYAAVSAGALPDTSIKSYRCVQRLLNVLRKKGVIPYPWIVDNIRSRIKPSSWSGLSDFAETVQSAYRKDFWAQMEDYVAIVVEKDTVAGRIEQVTDKYDVPMYPLRGYSSVSFVWQIEQEWEQIEKPVHVYYIGDHDPSGRDIERSLYAEVGHLATSWKRIAVEPRHFETFDIIPLEPKRRDQRYEKFAEEYGDRCAEVEAVPADDLRMMVMNAIEKHIPTDQWERLQKIEDEERQTWASVMSKVSA